MIEARGLVKRYGSATTVDNQLRRPARHGDRVPGPERRGQALWHSGKKKDGLDQPAAAAWIAGGRDRFR